MSQYNFICYVEYLHKTQHCKSMWLKSTILEKKKYIGSAYYKIFLLKSWLFLFFKKWETIWLKISKESFMKPLNY